MGTSKDQELVVPKFVQNWITSVRLSNKVFEKASPAKKRVMLAKDVLAAIKSRRFTARSGTYQPVPERPFGCNVDQPAIINLQGEECEVCAKGALFVSKLDRLNGLKLFEVSERDPSEHLLGLFTQLQLDLIETAFEESTTTLYLSQYQDKSQDCFSPEARNLSTEQFYELENKAEGYCRGKSHAERMRAIMLNVVANNGTFDPSGQRRPKTLKKVTKNVAKAPAKAAKKAKSPK